MLLLGETAAHALLARLAEPNDPRHRLLDLTAVGAALTVLSLAALAWRAASSVGSAARTLPAWRLAAVPALAFVLQEHLERFLVDGHAGWLTAADPDVLAGTVLQLAVGAAVLWLARSLLRAADHLACALARRSGRRRCPCHASRVWPLEALAIRLPALASSQAGRAPPVAA